jgi:dipeptidyl aminopeptidase/acylaminoacyl peptidase
MKPSDIAFLHALSKPAVAPDGRFAVVAVTRPDLDSDDYRGQLWIVPTDGSAPPRPLTTGWRDTAPVYSPDGAWLAFLRAMDGEWPHAKPQVYVMPTAGGEPRRVTDHLLGAGAPRWSPDSRRIAYISRVPDDGRYAGSRPGAEPPRRITTLQYREDNLGFVIDRRSHVFVVDPFAEPASEPVQVTSGDFEHADVTWSPDGQHLAFVSARHDGRDTDLVTDVWQCAPDGSQPRSLTRCTSAGGLMLSIDQVSFTPDGTSVCFVAIEAGADGRAMLGRNSGLWSVAADGSAPPRRLTDAEAVHIASGRTIETTQHGALVTSERRGAVELLLVPYDGGEPETLMSGRRQIEGIARTDSMVVAAVTDPDTCGELVALAEGTERRLTSFAAISAPLRPTEITATAPDGYEVHGWIMRPAGTGPHPVLLLIHGGPFTQYGWRLFDEAQVYAGAGYAVVMGNPRGSSGYGQAHGRAIIGDAPRAASDLLALLDAALAAGGLDGSRTGVLGGSYGGYMTTWLAAHHGDRFKAAASERAVNAVDSFHGSSDIGWAFAAALWGPDPASWAVQSPLTYASQISIPMLIIHSEHDWRCPVEQAQRLFVALKLRGIPAEMLLFPGEGHELTRTGRPSHRVARFEAILDWWSRHL